ncbi:hypothetical protein HOLDEFILI_01855 [Holdemania filiformis DSM 12042]|uniref:Uncharacterized protein n=1 Tax=Holdemania filiformis DSM 12042 TaxID=545696 RepID=B9Y7R0_9FIRM|nr:hypothetical protein HOLDEFILI_01855 [Holdemania filiformis DSM 12042]
MSANSIIQLVSTVKLKVLIFFKFSSFSQFVFQAAVHTLYQEAFCL